MACVHEFGILAFDHQTADIDYEPHEYNCISVDDDIINSLIPNLSMMRTYFHSFNRPEYGLAHWGITIIPPESLSLFYDVVTASKYFKRSSGLHELASKIVQAKAENKHMIHFGI
ncbi:short-chain dehydrogenase [Cohnella sp. 56]|uniref:short-chain dehydrogenase n=1 Tax=Cohnella sp. 56 TaxID=3113722 RepID=UPI0030E7924B